MAHERMLVRRMALIDVDAVHSIEEASFALPWKREAFEEEIIKNKCARYLVVEAAGEVVAFAGIWMVLEEGHITNIAVRPDKRGMGYGRKVTGALLQYASNLGVSYVTLEVRRSNQTAQNLYTSLGFVPVGLRKRYYEDNGEDALLMVCQTLPAPEPNFVEIDTIFEEEDEPHV